MRIKKLLLANFRNFEKREFEFSSQTTLIVGRNASGKTNLLEAVYLLARGHSFRGGRNEEMINYQSQIANIKSSAFAPSTPSITFMVSTVEPLRINPLRASADKQILSEERLEIILTRGEVSGIKTAKKKYLVNGVGKRAMDFVGLLRVVIFKPEDLEIVINSPSTRRDYLDSVLEQTDREYLRASLSYKKGLRQRNKLLEQIRERQRDHSSLFFWDKLLVENGRTITAKRSEFIEFINRQPDYFEDLEVEYDQSIISPERLEKYREAEVAAGMTLVGPHRDDFRINARSDLQDRKRNISVYGSRGEQRLAVFCLKLAELEFFAQKTKERPILLLDDIFSELDETNRQRLLEVIPKQQTLITATNLQVVDKEFLRKMEVIRLN